MNFSRPNLGAKNKNTLNSQTSSNRKNIFHFSPKIFFPYDFSLCVVYVFNVLRRKKSDEKKMFINAQRYKKKNLKYIN